MITGLLLMAAALGLTGYNVYEAMQADMVSENALGVINEALRNKAETEKPEDSLALQNLQEKEMPTIEIDGERYIGILEIEDIHISLPVMGGQWSYKKLRSAPCRYYGSVYEDNMVIAAHNYNSHFGKLKSVQPGSEVRFTDVDGKVFTYEVLGLEVLGPEDVESMTNAANWDLTLFTCTYGGEQRYTLRCVKTK